MKFITIDIKNVFVLLLSLIINTVQHSQLDNQMGLMEKQDKTNNKISDGDNLLHCPSNIDCHATNLECMDCRLNMTCKYGAEINTNCTVKGGVRCKGNITFMKKFVCRYCYQTEDWEHTCVLKATCNTIATTRSPYQTNCTVKDDILCLGNRTFNKNVQCNWTGGYRWITALALSIALGGFGADRFYLGHWQEGIGKLFSFGGLGVWTLIDVVLISLHYLGPADGSLYI